jgi:hypothetical protein
MAFKRIDLIIGVCIILIVIIIQLSILFTLLYPGIPEHHMITFGDYLNNAMTGDLIFFTGTRFATIIALQTKWVHVGMIIRGKWKDETEERVMVLEANVYDDKHHNNPYVDLITNKKRSGIQLVDIVDRLAHHHGYAAVRRLSKGSTRLHDLKWWQQTYDPSLNQQRYDDIKPWLSALEGVPFNQDSSFWISNYLWYRGLLPRPLFKHGQESQVKLDQQVAHSGSLFCSELVAKLLRKMGMIDSSLRDEHVLPPHINLIDPKEKAMYYSDLSISPLFLITE